MSIDRLHDLTHRVPGVPAHEDGGLQARKGRPAGTQHRHTNPSHRRHPHVHTREPRVLVRWQRWIASLGRTQD